MKTAGILVILFSGAGIGMSKSRELTRQVKILEALLQLLMFLKGEIRCTGAALEDAFGDSALKMTGEYRSFMQAVAQMLKERPGIPFGEIFRQCAKSELPLEVLDGEDRGRFLTLGEKLGYLDRNMQVAQLTLLEEELTNRVGSLRKTMPEKQKVYKSLGILGGILLAVLFW